MEESTDRCSKRAVLYFLSYLTTKYNIIICRMNRASDHGNIIIDDINVCDKTFLMENIYICDWNV